MGVPISEVGYTPSMPRREDHEVHKGHVVALEERQKHFLFNSVTAPSDPGPPYYEVFTIRYLELTTGKSHKTDIHAPGKIRTPQSQQTSGRRPTP